MKRNIIYKLQEFLFLTNQDQCSHYCELDLSNQELDDLQIKQIMEHLEKGIFPKDFLVNFSFTSINVTAANAIANSITSGKLPEGIQFNLRDSLDAEGREIILKSIKQGPKRLSLEMKMTAQDIVHTIQDGNYPEGLRLHVCGSGIGDAGFNEVMTALPTSLQNYPPLYLNLWGNQITDVGAKYLAKALYEEKGPNHLTLNLHGNKITDQGAINIADALKKGYGPLGFQLELQNNPIKTEGVQAFAKALRSNTQVVKLELPIKDQTIERCSLRNRLIQNYPQCEKLIKEKSYHAGLYELEKPFVSSLSCSASGSVYTNTICPKEVEDFIRSLSSIPDRLLQKRS